MNLLCLMLGIEEFGWELRKWKKADNNRHTKDSGRWNLPNWHLWQYSGFDAIIYSVVDLHEIKTKFDHSEFELSQHAVDQTILRHITMQELREAIAASEILEDYPSDKYGPSCLLLGFTVAGRPIHAQVSYPSRPIIKVITTYEPDPKQWINHRIRRPEK